MATVNFSVPDDVKDAFNKVFEGQNKSAIIADLMREAIDRADRQRRSRAAIKRILKARLSAPIMSNAEMLRERRKGRP